MSPHAYERGSASLELALITPVLLLLLLFVVGLGRLGQVREQIDGSAAQAARAASITRSPALAQAAAERSASANVGGDLLHCSDLTVAVDTSAFQPGGQVVVDLTCKVPLRAVSGIGFPGSKTLTSRAVAVVDTFRGLE